VEVEPWEADRIKKKFSECGSLTYQVVAFCQLAHSINLMCHLLQFEGGQQPMRVEDLVRRPEHKRLIDAAGKCQVG
jgi:hypothetical protein